MSELNANNDARRSRAALGLQAVVMPSSKSPAGLHSGTGISCSKNALDTLLRVPEEHIMADNRQKGAADIE